MRYITLLLLGSLFIGPTTHAEIEVEDIPANSIDYVTYAIGEAEKSAARVAQQLNRTKNLKNLIKELSLTTVERQELTDILISLGSDLDRPFGKCQSKGVTIQCGKESPTSLFWDSIFFDGKWHAIDSEVSFFSNINSIFSSKDVEKNKQGSIFEILFPVAHASTPPDKPVILSSANEIWKKMGSDTQREVKWTKKIHCSKKGEFYAIFTGVDGQPYHLNMNNSDLLKQMWTHQGGDKWKMNSAKGMEGHRQNQILGEAHWKILDHQKKMKSQQGNVRNCDKAGPLKKELHKLMTTFFGAPRGYTSSDKRVAPPVSPPPPVR